MSRDINHTANHPFEGEFELLGLEVIFDWPRINIIIHSE